MTSREAKRRFLESPAFAVVGASRDRRKFGNRVLRKYLQHGLEVYPVNPREAEIEGLQVYSSLAQLPDRVHSLSIVTPPEVAEEIVRQAIARGIPNLWMQPGAESPTAVRLAREAGLNVIADGSCILVELG
ncbi:MAG TPA: CoA-binding protein [bacterium]|nr:CoA-binding protein [bacterium]